MTYISDRYDVRASQSNPGGLLLHVDVTTGPQSEPLTKSDVKDYLKVEHTADDTLIDSLITWARSQIERDYNLALITQTVEAIYGVPLREAELPRYPFDSLNAVTEIEDGSETTLTKSDFYVDNTYPPVLHKDEGATGTGLISSATTNNFRIKVEYDAGFGGSGSDVPDNILQAMRLMIADAYQHRGTVATSVEIDDMPLTVDDLMQKWKDTPV